MDYKKHWKEDDGLLDLSNKNLEYFSFNDIPIEIRQKIKRLNLSHNKLKSFLFTGCPNSLTHLYLDFNQLELFSFAGCADLLTHLYLDFNQLESFSFEVNISLIDLYLGWNKFKSFSFEGCTNSLEIIWLHGNNIKEVIGNIPANFTVYGLEINKSIEMCNICFEEGEMYKLSCNHTYHKECVEKWWEGREDRRCCYCTRIVF